MCQVNNVLLCVEEKLRSKFKLRKDKEKIKIKIRLRSEEEDRRLNPPFLYLILTLFQESLFNAINEFCCSKRKRGCFIHNLTISKERCQQDIY